MRNLQSKSRVTGWLILTLLLMLPTLTLVADNPGLTGLLRGRAPDGQLLYLLSKLFGLCAFVLLCFQIFMTVLGLLKKRFKFVEAGKSFHIALGLVLMGVILSHASLFILAVSLRSGDSALYLLLPNMTGGYYALAVSLGVLALYLVICSVYFGFRARSQKLKSGKSFNGHLLVYVFSALVLVHARMIGSEIQSGWFQWFYWLVVICFAVTVLIRLTGLARTVLMRSNSQEVKTY